MFTPKSMGGGGRSIGSGAPKKLEPANIGGGLSGIRKPPEPLFEGQSTGGGGRLSGPSEKLPAARAACGGSEVPPERGWGMSGAPVTEGE
jgi:hypothetical protein